VRAWQGLNPKKRNGPTEVGPLDTWSVDDLNDPMRRGIDQYRAIIDDRIAIIGHAILTRHFVIGDAARQQVLADANLALIAI
jgi:hypothetical protein